MSLGFPGVSIGYADYGHRGHGWGGNYYGGYYSGYYGRGYGSYYAPIPVDDLRAYADQLPPDFPCCIKAPAGVTAYTSTARGGRADVNPDFLSVDRLVDDLLAPLLLAFRRHTGAVILEFPPFAGPDYEKALALARASAEYLEVGQGDRRRHRARFYPQDAERLRDLFDIVGRFDSCEVLIDDRPVPYARELWLPLIWFLIR